MKEGVRGQRGDGEADEGGDEDPVDGLGGAGQHDDARHRAQAAQQVRQTPVTVTWVNVR